MKRKTVTDVETELFTQIVDEREACFAASTARLLRFFDARHLPPHLKAASMPFASAAATIALRFGHAQHPELTVALRKLLEAKDCAVRAVLDRCREDPLFMQRMTDDD